MTINLSKARTQKYIYATNAMRQELSKNRTLKNTFYCRSARLSEKAKFIESFLATYNLYAYYKEMYNILYTESLETYCSHFGSPKDLQSFKLILSGMERFKDWGTNKYSYLCVELSKGGSLTGVHNVIHDYFTFLAYETPSKHGIDALFEEYGRVIQYDYCRTALREHYKAYAGLKAEHEYVIKPITIEVVKNANNYYKELYSSMPD